MKHKNKKQLYGSAALLFFAGSWLLRSGWESTPMVVAGSAVIFIGLIIFVAALTKQQEPPAVEGNASIDSYTTKQVQLLAVCSLLFCLAQVFFSAGEDLLFQLLSAILMAASFILLIIALPKRHRSPVYFFLIFLVIVFVYLHFFE